MASVALVLAAGLQLALPSAVTLPPHPHAQTAVPTLADAAIRVAPAAYAAIMAHPIFAPDRAPPPAEADASGNLSGYEVLGTAIAGKTAAAALLRDSGGEITRVKVGEEIDGWKLMSIASQELVFDRNGERRSLTVDMTAPARTGPGGAAGANRPGAAATASDDSSEDDSDDDDDQ
jgi:hypothetical protein